MNYLEEFKTLLADSRLVHYAYRMNPEENSSAGIFEDFEIDDFPNKLDEGDIYGITGLSCGGHYWMVASIPIRSARYMEALAKKNGLIIRDSNHAPQGLQIPTLFVLEKNPGYIDTDSQGHMLQ